MQCSMQTLAWVAPLASQCHAGVHLERVRPFPPILMGKVSLAASCAGPSSTNSLSPIARFPSSSLSPSVVNPDTAARDQHEFEFISPSPASPSLTSKIPFPFRPHRLGLLAILPFVLRFAFGWLLTKKRRV